MRDGGELVLSTPCGCGAQRCDSFEQASVGRRSALPVMVLRLRCSFPSAMVPVMVLPVMVQLFVRRIGARTVAFLVCVVF